MRNNVKKKYQSNMQVSSSSVASEIETLKEICRNCEVKSLDFLKISKMKLPTMR